MSFGQPDLNLTSLGSARASLAARLREALEAEGLQFDVLDYWRGRNDTRAVIVSFNGAQKDSSGFAWLAYYALELNLGQAAGAAAEASDRYIDFFAKFADTYMDNVSITPQSASMGGQSKATGSERELLIFSGQLAVQITND